MEVVESIVKEYLQLLEVEPEGCSTGRAPKAGRGKQATVQAGEAAARHDRYPGGLRSLTTTRNSSAPLESIGEVHGEREPAAEQEGAAEHLAAEYIFLMV